MNNDLISREALKEHKFVGNKFIQIGGRRNGKTLEAVNRAYRQGWNDCIDAIIDNAPTVEMPKALGTVDENGNIKIELIRPTGEWKEKVETIQLGHGWLTTHEIVCSVCGKEAEWLDGGSQFLSNFCPNCGADMRGEEP